MNRTNWKSAEHAKPPLHKVVLLAISNGADYTVGHYTGSEWVGFAGNQSLPFHAIEEGLVTHWCVMGLDIAAYRQIELIDVVPDGDDYEDKYDWRATIYVFPSYVTEPDFPGRTEGLEPGGVYRYADNMSFRAGSYSGYNQWRDALSMSMLGVSAEYVWKHREEFKDKPFYLLIDFSDFEGMISGSTARKLARDFAEHQTIADEHQDFGFRELYGRWRAAFEMAADNGLVDFQ